MTWRAYAACKGQTRLFYDDRTVTQAARVCAACPVQAECARVARAESEGHGVWAGRDMTQPRRRVPVQRTLADTLNAARQRAQQKGAA